MATSATPAASSLDNPQPTAFQNSCDVLAARPAVDRATASAIERHEQLLGGVTYYVLFFLHLETRRVHIAGITAHPDEEWVKQVGRNVTMADWGFVEGRRYVIMDRDAKYTAAFREMLTSAGLQVIRLPPKSPNLNAFCERWVLSVKSELLGRLVIFGEEGCAARCPTTSSTITRRGIIRAKATRCYSRGAITQRTKAI